VTELVFRYVVDASVGIKLFVEEEFSEQTHALFSHLAVDPPAELFVPDLFYIECANILLKYTRRFGRSLKDSQADLADLSRLALKSTPTADLMENALLLGSELDLSAYDACYAVLAQQLGIPLVTVDKPLARKLEFAVFLGDLDIQPSEE
jgi:predicted nucleic acid-binding protein